MKYKSIHATARGASDTLKIAENDLRPPSPGEVRIKILAVAVCQDDVAVRVGNRPVLPKIPFIPGYNIVGTIDAVGNGVTTVAVGDRVASLTNFGGYAEYIYLAEDRLVHVPEHLDPAEVSTLILNYLVAYQILHRVLQVKEGEKTLIIGASGGVGTAFLQLGKLAGLKMYGLASASKHSTLTEHSAIPIDYRTQDFVKVLQVAEPEGIDYVLNGMDEKYFKPGLAVLRSGGTLAHYGGPESFPGLLLLIIRLLLYNLLPNNKKIKGYGTHRIDISLLTEDWQTLFKLLDEGQIKPIIARTFPILQAAEANDLLESGTVIGNIVLIAPEQL